MSQDAEEKVRDWGIWYLENKSRIPKENLQKRCEFYEKALSGCFEIMAILAKDIQELEQRKGHAKLWLPSSVRLDEHGPIALR